MPYPRTGKPAAGHARHGDAAGQPAHRAVADWRPGTEGWHRTLRLVVAAGVAVAGMCLVVGLTTLVVRMGVRPGSGPGLTLPDAIGRPGGSGQARGLRPPVPGNGRGATAGYRRLHAYLGTGRGQRGPFRIARPGTWALSWAYSCGVSHGGQFSLTGRSALAGNDVAVAASGPAGHGITWASGDPGRHLLTVRTSCRWAVTVLLAPASR